jgi:membrane protease YdiL (CAAX protease family)
LSSLFSFFALTFVATWASWVAAGTLLDRSPAGSPVVVSGVFLLGIFSPSFVALWLTFRADGRAGVLAMLSRLFQWHPGVRWYLFAIGFTASIKLTAALIHRVALGSWPRFGDDAWYLMFAAAIFSTITLGQAGEEIGWRGYALPRMAERIGLPRASLLLGAIWAVWHLPLFFIADTTTTGQSFPLYLLQVTALSVTMAWLYGRTGPSLWPVMLLHAAVNNTKDIVPSAVDGATNPWALSTAPVAWITVGLLWIVAAVLLIKMRTMWMIPTPARGKNPRP